MGGLQDLMASVLLDSVYLINMTNHRREVVRMALKFSHKK